MFEKHAPHGSINSLRNGLIVPSNHLRVSRLAFRIIRVSFIGVNKDFSEQIFHLGKHFVCYLCYSFDFYCQNVTTA